MNKETPIFGSSEQTCLGQARGREQRCVDHAPGSSESEASWGPQRREPETHDMDQLRSTWAQKWMVKSQFLVHPDLYDSSSIIYLWASHLTSLNFGVFNVK